MGNNILLNMVLEIKHLNHNKSPEDKQYNQMVILLLVKDYKFLLDKAIYLFHLIKNVLLVKMKH